MMMSLTGESGNLSSVPPGAKRDILVVCVVVDSLDCVAIGTTFTVLPLGLVRESLGSLRSTPLP